MKIQPKWFCHAEKSRGISVLLVAAVLMFCSAGTLRAQQPKQKPDNKKESPVDSTGHVIPMTDEQQIEYLISEMLGAWQIGDIELMHKDYADNVSFVNAGWAPPVFGWANYAAIYQQQKAHMQRVRMERSNTYIKVESGLAYVCYQWDFSGTVDGQLAASKGQTTLVLAKRNNRWQIVHNHTSLAQELPQSNAQPGGQPQQPQPTKPS